MRCYLAGPISGLTYDQSEGWREQFAAAMPDSIQCYSPLRGKREFLSTVGAIEQSYTIDPLYTDRGIMTRDHNDCYCADAIICNMLDVSRVSVGTIMEVAWSFAYKIPLVLIMRDGNVHDHPMVREAAGFTVPTIEDAIHIAKQILLPGDLGQAERDAAGLNQDETKAKAKSKGQKQGKCKTKSKQTSTVK